MAESTPKRKIKDSVFTDLFQNKKYLLQLYKALHPEDTEVTEDALADITIKHVLIDGDYNDLGFSVGNRLMVLVESQSTWTYNIIIRALMYLVQTYHDYFKRTNQNLYGSKKVITPKPELYVIFTGVVDRQHDVGYFSGLSDDLVNPGHLGYIEYLCKFGHLPDFSPYKLFSYYHPPVHHIISCLFIDLQIFLGVGERLAFENIQALTLLYSALCLTVSYGIFKKIKENKSLHQK